MLAAVLIGTFIAQTAVYAQDGPPQKPNARQHRIVGLWDVDVTITRCDNGAPLFTFPALHKYELGGTGQIVPATDPTALSAHMMTWNYAGNDDYQAAAKMFRFDEGGNYIGWVILNNEVSLSQNGNEYVGSGTAEFFNTAGVLVGASCPNFVATRFDGGL